MIARPTTLKLMLEHCPHAVTLYEAGAPQDRRIFAAGIAAHEILCDHGRHDGRSTPGSVCQALITGGRSGVDSEPPLPPDGVWQGRELAERWISLRGVHMGGKYEVGLAFDRAWEPTSYTSDSAWFRTRIDVLGTVVDGDDEWEATGVMVEDYKTSWAHTGETLLGLDAEGTPGAGPVALQQRAQAAAAWICLRDGYPLVVAEPAFLRVRISNLRTLRSYDLDFWLDNPDDIATLEGWADDLNELCVAAHHRPRVASPGYRCMGCPYLAACVPAAAWWSEAALLTEPDAVAQRWALAKATASHLEAAVREWTKGGAVIALPDGATVGQFAREGRRLRADAWEHLWEAWAGDKPTDAGTVALVRGMLQASKLGVTQVEKIARVLYPDRSQAAERREWVASLMEATVSPRLDVRHG